MSVKSRILEYIEIKGIRKSQFYKDTGLSNGYLDKNKSIGSDKLEIIVSKYNDINLEWLMLGTGNPLKKEFSDHPHDTLKGYDECKVCAEKEKMIEFLTDQVNNQREIINQQMFIINHLKEEKKSGEEGKERKLGG